MINFAKHWTTMFYYFVSADPNTGHRWESDFGNCDENVSKYNTSVLIIQHPPTSNQSLYRFPPLCRLWLKIILFPHKRTLPSNRHMTEKMDNTARDFCCHDYWFCVLCLVLVCGPVFHCPCVCKRSCVNIRQISAEIMGRLTCYSTMLIYFSALGRFLWLL